MKKLYYFTLILILFSCGRSSDKNSQLDFQKVEKTNFQQYINNKETPNEPNIYSDKTIFNDDYPIELTLYEDGKWFYHLANLDDGFGTWKYENGQIKLHAERKLFDMNILIEALDSEAKNISIRFSDRFGEKVLKMNKRNISN